MSEIEVTVSLGAPDALPPPPPPPPPRNESLVEHTAEPERATQVNSIDELDSLMADLNATKSPREERLSAAADLPPPPPPPVAPAEPETTHVQVTVTTKTKTPDVGGQPDVQGKLAMFEKKGNPPPPPSSSASATATRSVAPSAAPVTTHTSHHHHQAHHHAPPSKNTTVRENVSGIKKGDHCSKCHGEIVGDFVALHGKGYHGRCFTCADCNNQLGSNAFYDLGGGNRSCENCWRNRHAHKCHACGGAIVGEVTSAMGRKYHPQHFVCATCNAPFPNNSFYEHQGRPYCDAHFANLTGTICADCNQPISGEVTKAMGRAYHPQHFVCVVCRTPLHDYHNADNKAYCAKHFSQQRGETCSGCGQHTSTTTVSALNKKWHPECFSCKGCGTKLGTSFYDHNGLPYCKPCAEKH